MLCALALAAFAGAGYKSKRFEGGIGPKGERRPFSLTYEKLSKTERLVNETHFTKLPVRCTEAGSDEVVPGDLAAFNQPTEIWVFNKRKDIGGRKDFAKVWKGDGVPIEAPDGDKTKFRSKRAKLNGEFRDRFTKASGGFSIRWQEVDEDSGEVVYACEAGARWQAQAVKD